MIGSVFYVKADVIYCQERVLKNHFMLVENGIISHFTQNPTAGVPIDDYGNAAIIPGLIDLHIHGREGCDVIDCKMSSIETISCSLAEHGVTGFLATTVTTDWQQTLNAMSVIGQAYTQQPSGAQVLGGYSEGLFFSEVHKGAHNQDYFLELSQSHLEAMINAAMGSLKVVALAPEKPGANALIEYLTAQGIRVMLGHCDANYEQTQSALEHGACGGVHVFNGMRGIHHRDPGCAGAVLMNDDAFVEVIADGVHLHPTILKLIYKLKGPQKIALISDCINAGGLNDGEYKLGKMDVVVQQGVARTASGSLAGSTLTLEQAVKNMHQLGSVELREAINMASIVPAQFLNIASQVGSLAEGKHANFAILNSDFSIQATYVKGQRCFFKSA
ncbi:N-acetylglucosamine-6-phosphate deacetylase [Pseudoalteromonas sp. SR44-5]|uniref:N-acetylgalactosamine-6-phosphate deacetylase n=1 Tax=Pseudoalteromonas rhizosphaerae TaxID=2518973 RepID=A0ABW8KVG9_9GAMM|nr:MULTISPECIES: N-acetylglucosamine-6-phosphate deacetylase [unclassified Pseudoalteromonas]MBB1340684.1 N-acetylglucosamine-6-phosphate deacetylase [Pseudoalteromonas sp. SR45-6]MBB1365628.1 N-acetylglucosamine-6-phosphate deacetylase [Pseudoalteromonas sp. SR44-5]MBB1416060.1 N-acetylglucosamine-6-phosphate deacetylase [Pseudoalteromonas sp. SG44-1]MBB1479490.1 N-acetylglucosamine-6-phosphate deacetylase [Pseudoalteromonas sp. SG41-2]